MKFFIVFGVIFRVNGLNCPEARPSSTLYEYPSETKCIYVYDNEFKKNWVDAEKECQQIREMGKVTNRYFSFILLTLNDLV